MVEPGNTAQGIAVEFHSVESDELILGVKFENSALVKSARLRNADRLPVGSAPVQGEGREEQGTGQSSAAAGQRCLPGGFPKYGCTPQYAPIHAQDANHPYPNPASTPILQGCILLTP